MHDQEHSWSKLPSTHRDVLGRLDIWKARREVHFQMTCGNKQVSHSWNEKKTKTWQQTALFQRNYPAADIVRINTSTCTYPKVFYYRLLCIHLQGRALWQLTPPVGGTQFHHTQQQILHTPTSWRKIIPGLFYFDKMRLLDMAVQWI